MSRFVFKMPDLGEGTVDAEIVEWRSRSATWSRKTKSSPR